MICIPACPFGAVQKTQDAQRPSPPSEAPDR
jgi:Fe-S-cluster-containing hydrogenase component 2